MGKYLSLDLRQRLLVGYLSGLSCHKLARQFCVAPSTVIRLIKRYHTTGSIKPAVQGQPRGRGKLTPFEDFLVHHVRTTPDITMPELARLLHQQHGIQAHPSSLSRFLLALGYRYKKNASGGGAGTRRC